MVTSPSWTSKDVEEFKGIGLPAIKRKFLLKGLVLNLRWVSGCTYLQSMTVVSKLTAL